MRGALSSLGNSKRLLRMNRAEYEMRWDEMRGTRCVLRCVALQRSVRIEREIEAVRGGSLSIDSISCVYSIRLSWGPSRLNWIELSVSCSCYSWVTVLQYRIASLAQRSIMGTRANSSANDCTTVKYIIKNFIINTHIHLFIGSAIIWHDMSDSNEFYQ